MNIENFKMELLNKLKKSLKGTATVTAGMNKDIDPEITRDAITIKFPGETKNNVISISNLYHLHNSGATVQQLVDMVTKSLSFCRPMDTSRIVYRLINRAENEALLKDIPHIPFYDMAIIFSYIMENSKHTHLIITNELMEQNHLTVAQMTDLAHKNTFRHFPSIYFCCTPPVYVLTCKYSALGSSTILNNEFLSKIANEWNMNLLLLPSDDKSFALIPYYDDFKKEDIIQMTKEALTMEGPIVTKHAFLFNRETKCLELLD